MREKVREKVESPDLNWLSSGDALRYKLEATMAACIVRAWLKKTWRVV